jgi:hypothetical protein
VDELLAEHAVHATECREQLIGCYQRAARESNQVANCVKKESTVGWSKNVYGLPYNTALRRNELLVPNAPRLLERYSGTRIVYESQRTLDA